MTRPAIVKRPDGRLVAVAGASRSGKTVWTAGEVAAAPRLLVWDFKAEWFIRYDCERVSSFRELAELVKSNAAPARLAFCIPGMQSAEVFNAFCRLAWVWLRQAEGALVVEETASVTAPGKAPPAWGDVIRMSLGYGAHVYAITQRPAESDKTALGNASLVHCHRMATHDDRRYMAKLLDVPLDRVAALKPLDYIERHASGELVAGRVHIKRRRARASSET